MRITSMKKRLSDLMPSAIREKYKDMLDDDTMKIREEDLKFTLAYQETLERFRFKPRKTWENTKI